MRSTVAVTVSARYRRARVATFGGFIALGGMAYIWSTGVTGLREQLGLSGSAGDLHFGLIALSSGIAAALGSFFVGFFADRFGPRRVVAVGAVVYPLLIIALGQIHGWLVAVPVVLFLGLFRGAQDTALNAHGIEVERYYHRSIMSSFHFCYSLGGFLLGLAGSWLAARFTHSATAQFTILGAAMLVLGCLSVAWMLRQDELLDTAGPVIADDGMPAPAVATATILIMVGFGVLLLGSMIGENVVGDWGQEYIRRVTHSTAALAGVAVSVFIGAEAAGRLFGDRLAQAFGRATVVFGSGVLAVGGLGLMSIVQTPAAALIGFGISRSRAVEHRTADVVERRSRRSCQRRPQHRYRQRDWLFGQPRQPGDDHLCRHGLRPQPAAAVSTHNARAAGHCGAAADAEERTCRVRRSRAADDARRRRRSVGHPVRVELLRDAHAVLLPASSSIDFAEFGPFLAAGGRAILIGEDRAEYVARRMSDRRRATETAESFIGPLGRLRAAHGPFIVAVDQELGGIQRLHDLVPKLPLAAKAATLSSDAIADLAAAVARSARDLGITMFLAPVADVVTGPNPWLAHRTLGADVATVTRIATAFAVGVMRGGIVPVAKHFPGFAQLTADPALHQVALNTPETELWSAAAVFQALIAVGVPAVMTGPAPVNAIDPGVPASLSPRVMATLRQDFRFSGLIVTDDLEAPATLGDRTLSQAAILALRAGADLLLLTHGPDVANVSRDIVAAVERNDLSRARLAESAGRVRALAAYNPSS